MTTIGILAGFVVVITSQLGVLTAFVGVGLLVRRRRGAGLLQVDDYLLAFWVGLTLVTLFLLCWNFVLPVSEVALALVLGTGLIGIGRNLGRVKLNRDRIRRPFTWVAVVFVALLFVSSLSLGEMGSPMSYDSGVYHVQGVQWAMKFPVVPGLANLIDQLGFNNSSLLYYAMLNAGPWQGRANHLANGVLILALLLQGIWACCRLLEGDRHPRRVFDALLIVPSVYLAFGERASSYDTDLPASLVLMVAASAMYASLTCSGRGDRERYSPVVIAALLGLAVTLKASSGVFAVAAFATILLALGRPGRWHEHAIALSVAMVMAAVWAGRGIVLSGYPLFPATVGGLAVEWQVPIEHARALMAYIVHGARGSTQNLAVVAGEVGLSGWFPKWLTLIWRDPFSMVVPLAVAFAGLVCFATTRGWRTPSSANERLGWWLAAPLLPALVAWFVLAPDPRFGVPFFWTAAALVWGQVSPLWRTAGRNAPRGFVGFCVALSLASMVITPLTSRRSKGEGPLTTILKANLNRPDPGFWARPVPMPAKTALYTTRTGLNLTAALDLCWDTPIPCTPTPDPNLRLRDQARLARGFAVQGSWQMQNWPLSWQPDFLAAFRRRTTRD